MEAKTYGTNYRVATQWTNNSYILCNDIVEKDPSVIDNARFAWDDEETGEMTDIYQWFLSDCSDDDVRYLEETFGLLFTYSDLLDLYVLCVDHYGTSWDYVYCETTNEYAARELGQGKNDPAPRRVDVATKECPVDMGTPQSNY